MSHELLALLLLGAPLAAHVIALCGVRNRHAIASGIVVLSGVISALAALVLLAQSASASPGAAEQITWRWFHVSGIDIHFGVLLDGHNLIMGAVVGVITLCIQIYSLSYMAEDPGKGRFFSFLALFEWAMLSFVYAPNLLQTFIFWELVGLASFLLIGFWYQKPSAVAAAKKAFIMTRIGDIGLFVGLILLFDAAGTLDIATINAAFAANDLPASLDQGRVELIAALLFIGIVGKSAQFPLHTWLPDAMEGPTPVSALLHSATMVAAGVFLFSRFHDLFLDAERTRMVILTIAAFTAILASTSAMVAKDMKKILAFSSISQLGFMLMGLAAGSLFAGFFHLTTHAAFKALLFLCAGAYIHHYGTNDIVAIGRAGGRSMKLTTLGLLAGGAALAGIPPLAGFFSKEFVIGSLASLRGAPHAVFVASAYAAAFLTAYYTFRMIFLITRPDERSLATADEPAHAQHAHDQDNTHAHAHDSPASLAMAAPIALLTIAAAVLGFSGAGIAGLLGVEMHAHGVLDMAPAVIIALCGTGLAWWEFGRSGASQTGFVGRLPAVERLFAQRWYLDQVYRSVFVRPANGVAGLFYDIETAALDSSADGVAKAAVVTGGAVARGQTGRLQMYIGIAAVVIAAAAFYIGFGEPGGM